MAKILSLIKINNYAHSYNQNKLDYYRDSNNSMYCIYKDCPDQVLAASKDDGEPEKYLQHGIKIHIVNKDKNFVNVNPLTKKH